ncbi:hypothetical protein [Endozoicomonas acroporae]|uniref:hypothetical protein n=1 Tax=Endozoicomonas acroporae TaxID=1701104 RepID=UPI0013D2AA25|nr:hypothetical protein [Endozoicomonas acroporae]
MGSSSALKKLKKLGKKSAKLQTRSWMQLQALAGRQSVGVAEKVQVFSPEVKSIVQDAVVSAARELAAPCNPLISWFQEGNDAPFASVGVSSDSLQSAVEKSRREQSILHIPLKSPPCKQCPAKANGICKCAAKKFGATGS